MFAAVPAACTRRGFMHRTQLPRAAADVVRVPCAVRTPLPSLLRTTVARGARRVAAPAKKGLVSRLNDAFSKHS